MANQLFNSGREGFLDGTIDWDTNDIRCMFIRDTYTYDATDKFIVDLGSVDNGRSIALTGKTVTAGVAGASNTTITATAAVATKAVVVFQHTGSDATARLIGYIDTPSAGLPFTPSVNQVCNINFDTGANKIFKL